MRDEDILANTWESLVKYDECIKTHMNWCDCGECWCNCPHIEEQPDEASFKRFVEKPVDNRCEPLYRLCHMSRPGEGSSDSGQEV